MKIFYRKDIEGLRAIAVLSVILYHTKFIFNDHEVFQGGFVGVDIFFVISGYLITSIIFSSVKNNDNFSIIYFYERRIRRIIPLLIFVLIISLFFGWIYLLPVNFIDLSKSIISSLFFFSNVYFYFTGLEYSSTKALLIPLLHTWSLSVEGQFYLLFPIILLIVFKYFKKNLFSILLVTFLFSIIFSHIFSNLNTSLNFYNLISRIWELLAGSLISYFHFFKKIKYNRYKFGYLRKLGILLIVISILFFNDSMKLPSLLSLIPILGACLIIFSDNQKESVYKILSSKLFVLLGLISYSLFLWHYPIFSYYRIQHFEHTSLPHIFIIFIFLFTISIISYNFIEKPFRNKKFKFTKILWVLLVFFVILNLLCILTISNNGYSKRFPQIISKNINETKPWMRLKNKKGEVCSLNNKCSFNPTSKNKVFLLGDSHMKSIAFDVKNELVKRNYHVIPKMVDGCYYFPGFNLYNSKTKKFHNLCNNEYFTSLEEKLLLEKNSIILIWGYLPDYLNFGVNTISSISNSTFFVKDGEYKSLESSFKSSITKISKNNKVILIYPMPKADFNIPEKFLNNYRKNFKTKKNYLNDLSYDDYLTIPYENYKKKTYQSFKLLDSVNGKNIFKVYPHSLFCDTVITNECITHDKENIFYSDSNHPSIEGSKIITNLILKHF